MRLDVSGINEKVGSIFAESPTVQTWMPSIEGGYRQKAHLALLPYHIYSGNIYYIFILFKNRKL